MKWTEDKIEILDGLRDNLKVREELTQTQRDLLACVSDEGRLQYLAPSGHWRMVPKGSRLWFGGRHRPHPDFKPTPEPEVYDFEDLHKVDKPFNQCSPEVQRRLKSQPLENLRVRYKDGPLWSVSRWTTYEVMETLVYSLAPGKSEHVYMKDTEGAVYSNNGTSGCTYHVSGDVTDLSPGLSAKTLFSKYPNGQWYFCTYEEFHKLLDEWKEKHRKKEDPVVVDMNKKLKSWWSEDFLKSLNQQLRFGDIDLGPCKVTFDSTARAFDTETCSRNWWHDFPLKAERPTTIILDEALYPTNKRTFVCPGCGSSDVERKCCKTWDVQKDCWVPYDSEYLCNTCGGNEVKEVPLP